MLLEEEILAPADTFDPLSVAWVFSLADLQNLGQAIRTATEVVADLETTGLDEHAYTGGPWNGGVGARVALAALTLPQPDDTESPTTWVLPLSHPESVWRGHWRSVAKKVFALIAAQDKPLTNANVKFDCRWLFQQTGVDLSGQIVWDTQISSHLLDENASTKLKERAPATFGVERWDEFDLSAPGAADRVPLIDLGLYAARDTYWTWKLAKHHRRIMFLESDEEGHGLEPDSPDDVENARLGKLATWVAMPTTATLTAIEQRGMVLDRGWVYERIAENEAERIALHANLAERYLDHGLHPDDASFAPTSLWFLKWTEVAVDTGDLRVGGLTKTGRPTWGKGVLTRQARLGSEVAQQLLDYRQRVKRLEYLKSWLHHCKPDGRVHAQYNAGSVLTGRLSSSLPNLQQVTAVLRPAFIPSPGYVIADFDYSQIELRVAAFISRCQPMIDAYRENRDLHLQTAGGIVRDQAVRAAKLHLMQLGLLPDRSGAEALRLLRRAVGEETSAVILRVAGEAGSDQDARSRERWCSNRRSELAMAGRSLPAELAEVPQGVLRALRDGFERVGGPWHWRIDDAGRASSRLGPLEQLPLELDDAVQVVSSTSASELQRLTDEPWGDYRQRGKAAGFGLIYGMGAGGFQEYADMVYGVQFTDQEALDAHAAFFDLWVGLREWHNRSISRAHQTGQIVSPLGRVRRLPDIHDGSDFLVSHAERQAINSPVQGFASDLMQTAAASIEGKLPGHTPVAGVRLVATVHDSIVAELPQDRWQECARECVERMISVPEVLRRLDCDFDIPLVADVKCGTRWGLSDVGKL